jgi:2-dehydropantoate 2-reductase
VIGTVYAARFAASGLEVTVLARGDRLRQLQQEGAIVIRAPANQRLQLPVRAVEHATGRSFDLILLAVRRDQAMAAATQVAPIADPCVLFFGNYAGLEGELADRVGRERSAFGFPGIGGVLDGSVVRYVQISQQPSTLGRAVGAQDQRVRQLAAVLRAAGFPVSIVRDMPAWLDAHAAFIVPVAAAVRAAGGSADALARNPRLLRLMVLATREAYGALRARGRLAAPANLRLLYRVMPVGFARSSS